MIVITENEIFFEMLSNKKILKLINEIPVKCDQLTTLDNQLEQNKKHWKSCTLKIIFISATIAGLGCVFLWFISLGLKKTELKIPIILEIVAFCIFFLVSAILSFDKYFGSSQIKLLKEQVKYVQLAAAMNDRLIPNTTDFIYAEKKYHEKHKVFTFTWNLVSESEEKNETNFDYEKSKQNIDSVGKRLKNLR